MMQYLYRFGTIGSVVLALAGSGLPDAHAQPAASEVLRRSQAYHDPGGRWAQVRHVLELRERRPDGRERLTGLVIDWAASLFEIRRPAGDGTATGRLQGAACEVTGVAAAAAPFRCSDADPGAGRTVAFWRDYYGYLYGLPMNLSDAGALLDPRVTPTRFDGRDVWALKVTYEGGDTWYVYVDPERYALVGCRFYHDEAAHDGEYIVFEGEVEAGGLRLPRTRAWYTNQDGRYLGTDTVEAYRIR